MDRIIHETSLRLVPGETGPSQSASYAFSDFRLDGDTAAILELSFESSRTVQLPLALYDPDGRARLNRTEEPSRGPVSFAYRFGGGGPGTWKIIFAKRILTEPLRLRLRVLADASRPLPAPRGGSDRIYSFDAAVMDDRPGWYCGEIHLHSDMSTGRTDVATIARVAVERGLDFIGLTDHFTSAHWDRIEELESRENRPLFIRSVEVAGERGHANLHGLTSWPDPFPDDRDGAVASFLGRPVAGSMERAADLVHGEGGLFCLNHPLSPGVSWRYRDFPLGKADLFEVTSLPDGPTSFLYPILWDRLLCDGLKTVGVGSSDSHDPLQDGPWAIGRLRNWVYARSLSREGILEGLAKGRCYVAIGASRLDFSAGVPPSGRQWPVGSTVPLRKGETCRLVAGIKDHPAGNLFAIQDGFLRDVRRIAAGEGTDFVEYEIGREDLGTSGESYLRLEFHEELEPARYHGMAYRDHRSLRLLSNPIHVKAIDGA